MPRLVSFISLLLFASVAFAATPQLESGKWRYAGGTAEIEATHRTVDAIVDDLNVFIRPIARPRLKNEAKPWKTLSIVVRDESVTVTIDGKSSSSPLGRDVQRQGPEDELTLHREMRGDVLVETWTSDRGGRTNEYHPSGDGVRVVSKIFSPRLPRPLEFTYTYR